MRVQKQVRPEAVGAALDLDTLLATLLEGLGDNLLGEAGGEGSLLLGELLRVDKTSW